MYVCMYVHMYVYVCYNHDILWFHRADQQHIIDVAAANNVSAVHSVFDSLDWSEESYRKFERIGHTADHRHFCVSSAQRVGILVAMCTHELLCSYACMYVCMYLM